VSRAVLAEGPIELLGRIMPASNHTYLCNVGSGDDAVQAVYKPVSGERPLWDFPDGSLAGREYAAWRISSEMDWNVVPLTLLREGPAGPGMVQVWQEPSADASPVDVVPGRSVPAGFLHVLDAHDNHDRPVSLIHEDSAPLRRMAVFDVLVNNTDRKGGHVLAMEDGHRYGVDHGICFHEDDKLRTVLWGWAGLSLNEEETAGVVAVRAGLKGSLGDELAELLSTVELRALKRRCDRLLHAASFPVPEDGWPSIPWPPF
jgi:uncharacterized repeat protein (TIGR03843 family)